MPVLAAPSLTINSPQNATYNATRIDINVTSNETVDFYLKGASRIYVVRNATSYVSTLYAKKGERTFSIFANNSAFHVTKNLSYTVTASNPINITSPGLLGSSDTIYRLENDISGSLDWASSTTNISVDLNGYTVNGAGFSRGIGTECSYSRLYNGTVIGNPALLMFTGSNCLFENVTIIGSDTLSVGIEFDGSVTGTTFDSINVSNVGTGVLTAAFVNPFASDILIKNSRITAETGGGMAAFDHEFSGPDSFTLETTNITDFGTYFIWSGAIMPQYTLRSTVMPVTEQAISPQGVGRIYKQHRLLVNITDNLGNPVAGVLEIKEKNTTRRDKTFDITSNPSDGILVATNESGNADFWITERVSVLRVQSPLTVSDIVFSPYDVVVRAKNTTSSEVLNVIGNSTFTFNTSLAFPSEGSLPTCTIDQMLDLNNDGVVDTNDAKIIMKRKVGHNVTINTTKGCNAVSFLPV